ncbi:MAG: DUF4093 domain-containing protein [Clostridia bacterium]|nr:DUF4093 domain-containing protein [Clostridia bacterium]
MKKRISLPVIVEGKYDKITLTAIFDCTVITTGGFGIFNSKEKQALLRRIAKDGVIVLVDSDGGGKQIRAFLSSILPKDKIHNLHIPKMGGKERRKEKAGKAGILGVEGMPREVLERLFSPFFDGEKLDTGVGRAVTKLDFFEDGLSGGEHASKRRAALCGLMELPPDMTANALLEAVNLLYTYDDYKGFVESISDNKTVDF